jgi:predicted transcriptional regulator
MKAIVIGILPQEKIRGRVLSIARGEYKPKPSDPKIWFTSMRSLAELTGRKPSNLSRTLKTMSNYGFVEMRREKNQVRPVAMATEFRIVA